jgi:hypothetical protein
MSGNKRLPAKPGPVAGPKHTVIKFSEYCPNERYGLAFMFVAFLLIRCARRKDFAFLSLIFGLQFLTSVSSAGKALAAAFASNGQVSSQLSQLRGRAASCRALRAACSIRLIYTTVTSLFSGRSNSSWFFHYSARCARNVGGYRRDAEDARPAIWLHRPWVMRFS